MSEEGKRFGLIADFSLGRGGAVYLKDEDLLEHFGSEEIKQGFVDRIRGRGYVEAPVHIEQPVERPAAQLFGYGNGMSDANILETEARCGVSRVQDAAERALKASQGG